MPGVWYARIACVTAAPRKRAWAVSACEATAPITLQRAIHHSRDAKHSIQCSNCSLPYCSTKCMSDHHRQRHAAFCSASAAHRAAHETFVQFASSKRHTQLLAAELVAASLMDRVARLAGAEKSSSSNLPSPGWETEYVCAPWPQLVVLPTDLPRAHEKRVRLACVADCETGRRLLLKALELGVHNIVGKGESLHGTKRQKRAQTGLSADAGAGLVAWLRSWLTSDRWQRLMGL